ncbi:hypothetical protein [Vibrio phage vB_VpaP_AL-1]|nr:hypothetical protein [Vibrio phage vB_VpaP_AL-1]
MASGEKPSEWCARMSRNAKDGDTAYHYWQMQRHWESKGQ